jgi:hypothetical protein
LCDVRSAKCVRPSYLPSSGVVVGAWMVGEVMLVNQCQSIVFRSLQMRRNRSSRADEYIFKLRGIELEEEGMFSGERRKREQAFTSFQTNKQTSIL